MKNLTVEIPILLKQIDREGTTKDKMALCRRNGISLSTYYRWKYEQNETRLLCPQCRKLAQENARLRAMLADGSLL